MGAGTGKWIIFQNIRRRDKSFQKFSSLWVFFVNLFFSQDSVY